jgi:carbon starvation protein
VATTIIVKSGKLRYVWVTGIPLAWLLLVTSWAALEKLFSPELRVGFLARAADLSEKIDMGMLSGKALESAPQLIFNANLNAALTIFFLVIIWVMVADTLRVCYKVISGRNYPPSSETAYEARKTGPDLAPIPEPTQL